ncbi:MAG: ATP-binding protein [Candidatus Omnitrophota bacterium]|nr:GAF domain-containing protein [Candidatus Omnitrophota bacterium]MBU1928280.1 GAF domain-containing protein [Candidatus Omnitrophota bacterium]MBU2035564.1 GAF domain-containing protein [Candidatus Omnitrophota bacterium]MBU2221797.1 GAF domain-containing protein [Candidatus Omnitrophota bacterium]MBU2257965.1 GAF domain-containing protein [Candidatus Omnitrophota bacterium]
MPELEELKEENKRLTQELKQKVFESSILYDISHNISYTLGYDDLLRLMMDSLHKIVDYDVCTSLILPDENKEAKMLMRLAHPVSQATVDEIQTKVIDALAALRGSKIPRQDIAFDIKGEARNDSPDRIKSSFDVPLFVRNRPVGILNVSSIKDIEYSDGDTKLLYTLASQAQLAIERLQAVLLAEKSKMRAMVEGMSEGVVMFDEKDQLIIFSAAAKEMLGYDLLLLGNLQEVKKKPRNMHKLDIPLEKPYPRVIHSEGICIEEEEGRSLGTIFLLRDVTKECEIDQMKSDFVSIVSHELRTPLAAMKGAVDNLMDGVCGELNNTQKECIILTQRNINRLSRLISDLLDISRIEAGKIQLNKQAAAISPIIEEVLYFFKDVALHKNVKLSAVFDEGLHRVDIDPDKITQVVTNLLSNAMKFTPKGGEISIKVSIADGYLKVSIKDTGIGIPHQDLDRVFNKFYQVDHGDINIQRKGTGLGLPICRGIIEKHGGRAWVESELGRGSTFSFTLPVIKE